jgi:hypothetical protein
VAADKKDDVLGCVFAALHQLNEGGGIQRLSGWIEKHFLGRRMPLKQVKAARHDFPHFTSRITAAPLHKLACDCVGILVARLADEV